MGSTRTEKPVIVIGIDHSEHSFYALEWVLEHFFVRYSTKPSFRILIVQAKPSPTSAIGLAGPGAFDVLPYVQADLRKIAANVIQKAVEVNDVAVEVMEGDARNVLCEVVEKHQPPCWLWVVMDMELLKVYHRACWPKPINEESQS